MGLEIKMETEIRDEGQRSRAVSFHLLPTDLIHRILLQLALPEIPRLGLVSKSFRALTSDPSFLHHYNFKSRDATWLFIYTKRWGQDALLKAITARMDRWFNFSIKELLAPLIHWSSDLYFLTACGNVFLFAVNTSKEIVSANLMSKAVKKIPPSPLGPRDTSSWRRSGMKLVPGRGGSDHYRFFFLEYVRNEMFLFEYDSLIEKWQQTNVHEYGVSYNLKIDEIRHGGLIFLTVPNGQSEHITLAIGLDEVMLLRVLSPSFVRQPTIDDDRREDLMDATLSGSETVSDTMRIYGDGAMLKVKSLNLSENEWKNITLSIELWGCLSSNGSHWELISKVPREMLMRQMKKPYGVMKGCLEREKGGVRAVLMSNYEGCWDTIWLSYEMEKRQWTWTSLPDCMIKGANMGGISFSSGLTLS